MPLYVHQQINNRYELLRPLKQWDDVETWVAQDLQNSEEIVLKIYSTLLPDVRILKNPHLIRLREICEWEGRTVVVMPYYPEGSLRNQIRQISEGDLSKVIIDVCDGLNFLHDQGIIHEAIKPDNILRDATGNYVVTDYWKGTHLIPDYKAPEYTDSSTNRLISVEIWALGATVYEVLEGHTPFAKVGGLAMLQGQTVPNFKRRVSRNMKSLVQSMLATNLWERPTTASLGTSQHEQMAAQKPKSKTAKQREFPKGIVILGVLLLFSVWGAYQWIQHTKAQNAIVRASSEMVDSIGKIRLMQTASQPLVTQAPSAEATNQTWRLDGVNFTMVYVEGGTLDIGATLEQDLEARNIERPGHPVTLTYFYIGQTEVTQALWQAVMDSNPSCIQGDNYPVTDVTWYECQTFVEQLNTRLADQLNGKHFALPTESQWEYAARGGQKTHRYLYSGSNTIGAVAHYADNSSSPAIVKNKNANELGIYDMTGNVAEWCADWEGEYDSYAQINPSGATSGSKHVIRGGGWMSPARACRVSARSFDYPDKTSSTRGVRICLLP